MNDEDRRVLENSEHIEKKDFNELKEYAIEDAKVLMPQMDKDIKQLKKDIKQLQWEKKILKDALQNIWDELHKTCQLSDMGKCYVETCYKKAGVYDEIY